MGKRKGISVVGKINNYKLAVFGSGAVGKSSLINRFINADFSGEYIPTVEDAHRYFLRLNNRLFNLTIVDTAGTHDFPAMKELSINESSAFILVFAVDDEQSLQHFKNDISSVLRKRSDASILIVGNKIDVEKRIVSSHEVTSYLEEQHTRYPLFKFKYLETSAKTNYNVRKVFYETLKLLQPCLITNLKSNKAKIFHLSARRRMYKFVTNATKYRTLRKRYIL